MGPLYIRCQRMVGEGIFAVLDVEATGFSPLTGGRVIEIAVVRIDGDGAVSDEYATLVNPGESIGLNEVHGIRQGDVTDAPTFPEIAGDVLERLEGRIVVGHNVRFDRDFLAAELSAAGIFLPSLPCLCTLRLAHRLHPEYPSHRIAACCEVAGLDHLRPHEALEEAKATALLLGLFMKEAETSGVGIEEVLESELTFPKAWPQIPPSGRVKARPHTEQSIGDASFLARIAAARSGPAPEESLAPYMDLLDRALEDRELTDAEGLALLQTAEGWGLSPTQLERGHQLYLQGVVEAALADHWVTKREREDLHHVAALLGIDVAVVESMLAEVAEQG
jgi:DNA polymerase III subunit epsilon